MKKTGYFFFSFLPTLLAFGLQLLATFFMLGIAALFLCAPGREEPLSYELFYDLLMDLNFNAVLSVIFSLSVIVTFGLWYYWKYEGNFLPKPSRTFHPLIFAGIVLFVPAAQNISTLIMSALSIIHPAWLETYEELMENSGLGDSIPLFMMIYAVIMAPIGEELIFRGVTLRAARKAMPFWLANLFQALLFGIFHMNVIQGAYAFALGILLGYICEKSGSIYYSIFLHFLFNLYGTCMPEFLDFGESMTAYGIYFMISIIIGIAGIFVFRAGRKSLSRKITSAEEVLTDNRI